MILAPVIRQFFYDSNGNPLIGGQLYSYVAATTTPQATYTDQSGGTPNSNPVVLDSSGGANVWIDPTLAYKFVLKDSLGNLLWTVDQVSGAGSSGLDVWNADSIYSQGAIVADSSGAGLLYVSLQSNNSGNALTNVSYWRMLGGNTRTLTSNTTLAVTDEIIRSNSTGGNLTQTLPPCSTTPIGKRITIKDVGTGGNTTTVKGSGSDNVDGANTYATALRANESITAENTGSAWDVVLAYITANGSVTNAKMAPGAVAQANLAARATGTSVAAGGAAFSNTCTSFSDSSGSVVDVTNLSVTLITTGRPIALMLVGTAGGSSAIEVSRNTSNATGIVYLVQGSTAISSVELAVSAAGVASSMFVPVGSINYLYVVAAGTYTFKVQAQAGTGTTISFTNTILVAYEI